MKRNSTPSTMVYGPNQIIKLMIFDQTQDQNPDYARLTVKLN